jgi:hypothetical protein
MSEDPGSGGDEASQPLPQHPFVERRKPDPSQPAQRVTDLVGLPGDSDRPGYQRLYLTTKLDYYAEFLVQDIVCSEEVAVDQSPFPGLEATRVSVRRDVTINYVWARSPQPVDEFDLDVRLRATRAAPSRLIEEREDIGSYHTCYVCMSDLSDCVTCVSCNTCYTCPNTFCFRFSCNTCIFCEDPP